MENVQQIIHKTRLLADRLKLALSYQNSIIKDSFIVTGLEFPETIDGLEKRLNISEKNFETIQDEVIQAKVALNVLSDQYKAIAEENSALKKSEGDLLNMAQPLKGERRAVANELRNKLKAYKALTGVRLCVDCTQNISGYFEISNSTPLECSLIPFEFDKGCIDYPEEIWEKIKAVCSELIKCK